jgi:hypothetical protein
MDSSIGVADIVRLHGESFQEKHYLLPYHSRVLRSIGRCRTAELGAHKYSCDSCGHEKIAYNSCRNRHCPTCQTSAKEKWLYSRNAELLPAPYFHAVFTIPQQLKVLARYNDKLFFNILFKAVSETLKLFGKNPKYDLNGEVGFMSILHTWNQKLEFHPHIHCVIPGGTFASDGQSFVQTRETFLFPVRALSKVFRAKLLMMLKELFTDGKIFVPTDMCDDKFQGIIDECFSKKWVVYLKKPFAGPTQVLEYLGRYTHRVAIGNYRIKKIEGEMVTFSYRDRKSNQTKNLCIPAEEFLRRFLMHVLPSGFMKIRYFGFLANRNKSRIKKVVCMIQGKDGDIKPYPEKSTVEIMSEALGTQIDLCPNCGKGKMVSLLTLSRGSPK